MNSQYCLQGPKVIRTKYFSSLLFIVFCITQSTTLFSMNILRPYDTLIRPYYDSRYPFQVALYGETGFGSTRAFDECGRVNNVLKIWNCDQNALKMLEGFNVNSAIGQLRVKLDANDDDVRGHFNVCGDLKLDATVAFAFRYFFQDTWSVSAYLPIYAMQLKNVIWQNQTKNITAADMRVKQLLTNNFFPIVKQLGNGLDLQGWKRSGFGDLALFLEWYRDFVQIKPLLKNVRINWRLGLIFPTGRPWDEDEIFAIPFGFDKSFAIPFGLGLDITLGSYLKTGLDVQLTHTFGSTRDRRIKTQVDQTELLLLEKTSVYKDFGLTQRFNLYVQFYKFLYGLSFKVGYQFFKKGDDELSLKTNTFSNEIANTAESLQERTMHHMVVDTTYDFSEHFGDEARFRSELSFYARLPFNGKRVALIPAIGAVFSIDF